MAEARMLVTIDVEQGETLKLMTSAMAAAEIRIRDVEAINRLLNENLTAVQAKCTELLEQNRQLRIGPLSRGAAPEIPLPFITPYAPHFRDAANAIQADHKAWADRNFPNADPIDPVLGVAEEVGELCHAILKQKQGIRGTHEQHEAKAKDAVGDIVIYLLDVCSKRGWSFGEIVAETWAEVRKRDWTKKGGDQ